MPNAVAPCLKSAALAALLALAACESSEDANIAALDNELMANGADPALTSALEDQIMVDPNLVQQAHPNAVRPPETPVQAQYPSGDAGDAQGGSRVRRVTAATGAAAGERSACGTPFNYGPQYAARLPSEFPAYPGGRVTEAAGSDRGDCHVRVVTFRTADPANRVLEYYRSLASRGGFSAEQLQRGGDQVLGGVNQATDGAYYLIVTPQDRGSEVALIVNNGR